MEENIKTTTKGHKIVFREATGTERRAYRRVALSIPEDALIADRVDTLEDALINIFIESVDGNTEDLQKIVLKLPSKDYDEVIEMCREILSGLEKKTDEK